MGQIGFTKIKALEELNEDVIRKAPLFTDQFVPEEWGGSNEPHLLKNGWVGVLGHIAYMDQEGNKHYHAMTFALNPVTGEKSRLKIIAVRNEFSPGAYKRKDLIDVIFSGGIKRLDDGTAYFYAGVSDAEAHKMRMPDPFLEYERF